MWSCPAPSQCPEQLPILGNFHILGYFHPPGCFHSSGCFHSLGLDLDSTGSPAGVALLALAQDGVGERGWRRSEIEGVVGKGLQGRARVGFHGCKALQFLCHCLDGRHLQGKGESPRQKNAQEGQDLLQEKISGWSCWCLLSWKLEAQWEIQEPLNPARNDWSSVLVMEKAGKAKPGI